MNKHFEDAVYYLGRAGEHAREGLREELAPLERRVRELAGLEIEEESERSRLERVRAELREIEQRAEGETKRAVGTARERLREVRSESATAE